MRHAWFAVALLVALVAPFAQAAGCDVDEVDVFFDLFHVDGTSEEVDDLALVEAGDRVALRANGPLHCEGVALSIVTYADPGGERLVFDIGSASGHPPRPGADFTFWEVDVSVPSCDFRVEVWWGEPGTGQLLDAADGDAGPCEVTPPSCPGDLRASSADGRVLLDWTAGEGAWEYNVYRARGDAPLALYRVVPVNETAMVDEDVTVGETYRYRVTSISAYGESDACVVVEVAAIPLFPDLATGALALGACLVGYAGLRPRRRG